MNLLILSIVFTDIDCETREEIIKIYKNKFKVEDAKNDLKTQKKSFFATGSFSRRFREPARTHVDKLYTSVFFYRSGCENITNKLINIEIKHYQSDKQIINN